MPRRQLTTEQAVDLNVGTLAGTVENLLTLGVTPDAVRAIVERVLAEPDASLLDVVRDARRQAAAGGE